MATQACVFIYSQYYVLFTRVCMWFVKSASAYSMTIMVQQIYTN